jgi:hypothetical protein
MDVGAKLGMLQPSEMCQKGTIVWLWMHMFRHNTRQTNVKTSSVYVATIEGDLDLH